MSQLLIAKLSTNDDAYISVIERKDGVLRNFLQRIYVSFTRFVTCRWGSQRYVTSRYYLIRLAKKLELRTTYKYCFSHTGKYSAVVFTTCFENFSVDIELAERRLSKTLRAKVRALYPYLQMPELVIIMILETLVKLTVFQCPFSLSMSILKHHPVTINSLNESVFEVIVNNVKVYSRIYRFDNLYICITREKNHFPQSL